MKDSELRRRLGDRERLPRLRAETRLRHLAALAEELERQPEVVTLGRVRAPARRRAAFVTALLFVAGTGVGVTAQGSMPGEPLHRVKLLLEWAAAPFDGDLAAANRLDELDRLIASRADARQIRAAQDAAFLSLAGRDPTSHLRLRFDDLVIGGREIGDAGPDPTYDQYWSADWLIDGLFRRSLPDGSLLEVIRTQDGTTTSVDPAWRLSSQGADHWLLEPTGSRGPVLGRYIVAVYEDGRIHIVAEGA
jgi:hypothetical protein